MGKLSKVYKSVDQLATQIVPLALSMCLFLSGIILLISGATPTLHKRFEFYGTLPLPAIELSHFTASIVGIMLMFLSQKLIQRLSGAYWTFLVLLVLGSFFSIIKGWDYEEALFLLFVALLLWRSKKYFYRKSSIFSTTLSLRWIVSITLVVLLTIVVGFVAYRNVSYSDLLWFEFSLKSDASRFLRASVALFVGLALIIVSKLFKPRYKKQKLSIYEEQIKLKLIGESSDTKANLGLLNDKQIIFNSNKTAFIMYGVRGKNWIAMGEPIGPKKYWKELVWDLKELADSFGGVLSFYQIDGQNLDIFAEFGYSFSKLGEEAQVVLKNFSLEGSSRKGLRATKSKMTRSELKFEVMDQVTEEVLSELKCVSNAWLLEKKVKEKKFSVGFFDEDYLRSTKVGVIRSSTGTVIAFTNLWLSYEKTEATVDLMRFDPDLSPNSIMEFLFIELILWAQEKGYESFNLGMTPLSGLQDHYLAPIWNKVGSWVFRHGEHFYNFQGLRSYKEKFNPEWKAKYLASKGDLRAPMVMADTSILVSGSLSGVFIK